MADQLQLTGKFLGAGKARTLGTNNFTVRPFWIETTDNPAYPNTPEFQLTGDKINLVDGLVKGQEIVVKFNINGRRYKKQDGTDGIITNLTAWRIEVVQRQSAVAAAATPRQAAPQQVAPSAAPQAQRMGMPAQPFGITIPEEDDLPF